MGGLWFADKSIESWEWGFGALVYREEKMESEGEGEEAVVFLFKISGGIG